MAAKTRTRPTVTSFLLRTFVEECTCENCGCPVEVGDRLWFAESDVADGAGCSRNCAVAAHDAVATSTVAWRAA